MRGEHHFDVRLNSIAERRNQLRRIGPRVVLGPTDELRAGAEREQNLRRRRIERDDARRRSANADGITEVVGRLEGRSARIPARERLRARARQKMIGGSKAKRTLLPEECPQRARAKKTPDRHQHLPRGSAKVARTKVVSWLRAAGLTFPTAPAVSGVSSLR